MFAIYIISIKKVLNFGYGQADTRLHRLWAKRTDEEEPTISVKSIQQLWLEGSSPVQNQS
jgi:hypothetical protein